MSLTISSGIPPHGPARDFDEGDNGTLIFWKIRCINSQTKLYFDRLLVIKTPDLPLAERQLLLSLTATSPSDPRILQHRQTAAGIHLQHLRRLMFLLVEMQQVRLVGELLVLERQMDAPRVRTAAAPVKGKCHGAIVTDAVAPASR